MIGKFTPVFGLLLLLAMPLAAVAADHSAADRPEMLVLRNGETLEGKISRQDDRFVVTLTDGEIRLLARDVDFLCHSLQEAYDVQSRRIVGRRIEDRLQLANWCLRHNLTGPAAQELAAAMAIDPNDRRVAVLDRRLQEMVNPSPIESPSAEEPPMAAPEPAADANPRSATSETAAVPKLPANADDLERMARNLPRGTLESYSTTILPLLLNHCATAGCHSVGTQSKFVLLRPTPGSGTARRLTLRDLHNTLDWVDYDTPANSKLLSTAKAEHATCAVPAIEKEESREYQQLVSWVLLATQGTTSTGPGAIPASVTPRSAPKVFNPSTRDPADASAGAPKINAAASPAGPGWANAIAPAGKVPPNIRSGLPAISKLTKPVQTGPTATAKTIDSNVKPAAAAAPQSTP